MFIFPSGEEEAVENCQICKGPGKFRCNKCKVAFYCGRDRQVVHFSAHKHMCKRVASLAATAEGLEQGLKRGPNDPFRMFPGEFDVRQETKQYVHARYKYMHLCAEMGTIPSIRAALIEGITLICLCDRDLLKVRNVYVSYHLRLPESLHLEEGYDLAKYLIRKPFGECLQAASVSHIKAPSVGRDIELTKQYAPVLYEGHNPYMSGVRAVIAEYEGEDTEYTLD